MTYSQKEQSDGDDGKLSPSTAPPPESPGSQVATSTTGIKAVVNWITWPFATSPQASHHDRNANRPNRVFGLQPRAKVSRDAVEKRRTRPFQTKLGLRIFPRERGERNPLRPTSDMIQKARKGHLTKFLRQGDIIRADEFGGVVDPITAQLQVSKDLNHQTECLSSEDADMADELKTEENLYFITVSKDELPSYHFWKRDADPDPLEAGKPIDWDAKFVNLRSVQDLKQDEDLGRSSSNDTEGAPAESVAVNDWMPGQSLHQDFNPKRGVRPTGETSTLEVNYASKAARGWTGQERISNRVWSTSSNGLAEGARQSGCLPDDSEWEAAEREWEINLQECDSLEAFLAQYKIQEPEKYAELTRQPTSQDTAPVPGGVAGTRSNNARLTTAVPTVAFKLTQQQFGRPVSALIGNEPLYRDQKPSDWDGDARPRTSRLADGDLVYHQEEPLEFLDFYDQKSYGQPMLRSECPNVPQSHGIGLLTRSHRA